MRGGSSYTYTHGGAHGVVSSRVRLRVRAGVTVRVRVRARARARGPTLARPWITPRWYGDSDDAGGEAVVGRGESEQSTP